MKKQTTIIHFVRHGEVDNPEYLRYGRLPNFHLSTQGRLAAERAQHFLIRRKINHIYTSPLERTQQTATIIGMAFPHLSIHLDDRLLEVKTSKTFEGKSRSLPFKLPDSPTSDAETAEQIVDRMHDFLEEKVVKHNGGEVLAVSHGEPMALLWNKILYNNLEIRAGMYPYFASVVSFVFEGLDCQGVLYQDFGTENTKTT